MLIAPEEFSCELDIPEANYTARKEAIYYPGECYSRFGGGAGRVDHVVCEMGRDSRVCWISVAEQHIEQNRMASQSDRWNGIDPAVHQIFSL